MTQERINEYFKSSLGEQCYGLFSTEDNLVFIRMSEALYHSEENGLDPDKIQLWYNEN